MVYRFKRFLGGAFFCLLLLLPAGAKSFALDRKESSVLSHFIMAAMNDSLGKLDEAVDEYKKALKLDFKNPVIHLNLASCYIRKNDINKATEELGLAVNFDPEAIEPHAILGLLYSLQNKPDEANREYEIALQNASKLEPKNVNIYKTLGALYLGQKKFDSAQNVYHMILNLYPKDAEAHFYLGSIYYEQRKLDLAESELKEAVKLNPDFHEALNYLGYFYVEENKHLDVAENMIKKAIEKDPDNGAYIDSIGWLYYKKGRMREARKELEKAAGLLEDPVIFDHLGDVCSKAGDLESARLNWEKSLKLDPEQADVKKKIGDLNKAGAAK